MASSEPVDIDHGEMEETDYKWGDDLMNDLERRFDQLRQLDETLDESRDKDPIDVMQVSI